MQARLDVAKTELQSMIAHWREKWKDVVTRWSNKIIVVTVGPLHEQLLLPSSHGQNHILLEHKQEVVESDSKSAQVLPQKFNCPTYDINDACRYQLTSGGLLLDLETNLAVDIFRHFVLAFDGQFLTGNMQQRSCFFYHPRSYCWQWLYIDEENKRHYKVISDSLLSTFERNNHSGSDQDRWKLVNSRGIQIGGKLESRHYIHQLLSKLRQHQMDRMIECHFHCADQKSKDAIIKTAKQFAKCLVYRQSSIIDIVTNGLCFELLRQPAELRVSREAMKSFNLQDENSGRHNWKNLLSYPQFVASLGDSDRDCGKLTMQDVQFIISWFIDAEYDSKETIEKIEKIEKVEKIEKIEGTQPSDAKFPTVNDDFSNFDPPHLRGILTETVTSRKLAKYASSIEEVRNGDFALLAPAALTEIVLHYLSVDLPTSS